MFKKKKTILIIDDDVTVRDVLRLRLGEKDGNNVLMAEDGTNGLAIAVKKLPDLILLDWMMPGMDGLEVLKKLKAEKDTAAIPVHMLTGKGVMEDVEAAFAEGADGYFTKPVRIGDLSSRVRKVLSGDS